MLRNRANENRSHTSVSAEKQDDTPANQEETGANKSEHVELFADFEDKMKKVKPMDEEKRLEQEKYEKQIGYLTYLGQDTHESLGTRSWYDVAPKRKEKVKETAEEDGNQVEIGLKTKQLHDPMMRFLKYTNASSKSSTNNEKIEKIDESCKPNKLKYNPSEMKLMASSAMKKRKQSTSSDSSSSRKKSKKSKKHKEDKDKKKKHKKHKKKHKHLSSDSEADEKMELKRQMLLKLREERIQREKNEQNRAKEFLHKKFPSLLPPEEPPKPTDNEVARQPFVKQKYNSQFNPMLAKQNYS